MGDHFARLRRPDVDDIAIERRFNVLLAAHPDDLGVHLRQAVSLLRSKEVPINWLQLFWDIQRWNHPVERARVRRRWARAFWGRPTPEAEMAAPTEGDSDVE